MKDLQLLLQNVDDLLNTPGKAPLASTDNSHAKTTDELLTALNKHFDHDNFRTGQREVVETILNGENILASFPTGYGKSLCYQLPALMLPGVTVVVSPLISLMKDQVDALRERGIYAVAVAEQQPELGRVSCGTGSVSMWRGYAALHCSGAFA